MKHFPHIETPDPGDSVYFRESELETLSSALAEANDEFAKREPGLGPEFDGLVAPYTAFVAGLSIQLFFDGDQILATSREFRFLETRPGTTFSELVDAACAALYSHACLWKTLAGLLGR